MRFFFLLFFLPITKAFVSVKIHRDSFYHPQSSCAFIGNTSFSNDSSIQSCIWQCVHEQNCQTAVYYKNEKICSMYSEFCETNRIQSLENAASSVIYPISTCPLSTTVNQEDIEETTTLDMIMTTDLPDPIILTDTKENIFGVWNTTAGGDSTPATPGSNLGNYPPPESPDNAFDRNPSTKYYNIGNGGRRKKFFLRSCWLPCGNCHMATSKNARVGPLVNIGVYGMSTSNNGTDINTGFYLTPNRGPSLVIALQFFTANDCEQRDPLTMTIEGSNQTSSALTLGSSWTLIYNGTTGLENTIQRYTNGTKIWLSNNSIWYSSYRLLITSKRGDCTGVQDSEVEFFGQ